MFHRAHTGAVRLALSTGTPIVPVGVDVVRERIRYTEVCVGDRVETGRWYLSGPYAVTVGEAAYLDGDLEDRAHVRSCSQGIMQQIARLARQSARRIAAPCPQALLLPGTAGRRVGRAGSLNASRYVSLGCLKPKGAFARIYIETVQWS